MRYGVKILVVLAVTLLLLPTLLFLSYDLFAFQSRRGEITAILSKATLDERTMTSEAVQLVHVAHGGRIAGFASRILIRELNIPKVGKGMLGWHATAALWWGLAALHLSEQEQVAIIPCLMAIPIPWELEKLKTHRRLRRNCRVAVTINVNTVSGRMNHLIAILNVASASCSAAVMIRNAV